MNCCCHLIGGAEVDPLRWDEAVTVLEVELAGVERLFALVLDLELHDKVRVSSRSVRLECFCALLHLLAALELEDIERHSSRSNILDRCCFGNDAATDEGGL